MKPLSRRSVTTGLAAAVTAIPTVALSHTSALPAVEAGRLTALVARYFAESDNVNETHHETDEELDSHLDATCNTTLTQIIGVPAPTARDALSALDFLIREHCIEESTGIGEFGPAVESMVEAIRGYLASQV